MMLFDPGGQIVALMGPVGWMAMLSGMIFGKVRVDSLESGYFML